MVVDILIYIFAFFVFTLLLSIPHILSNISTSELKRREKAGDKRANTLLKRNNNIADIRAWRFFILTLVAIAATQYGYFRFGAMLGFLFSFLFVYLGFVVSYTSWGVKFGLNVYEKHEQRLNTFFHTVRPFVGFLYAPFKLQSASSRLNSPEEFMDILENSQEVFTSLQKKSIKASACLDEKTAKDIMTPKKKLKTIEKSEILGPLVLDDLHKIGHQYLPVINKKLDYVVGLLRVDELLSVHHKDSSSVEKVMQYSPYFINQSDSVSSVLQVFRDSGLPMLIVVDNKNKTQGIITVADIVRYLLGD